VSGTSNNDTYNGSYQDYKDSGNTNRYRLYEWTDVITVSTTSVYEFRCIGQSDVVIRGHAGYFIITKLA
jgi:hypothetical protein